MHKKNPDQTILSVTHGYTLRYIMALVTNQLNLLPKNAIQACNNSISIVDFETKYNEKDKKEWIDIKMQSYNLQLI